MIDPITSLAGGLLLFTSSSYLLSLNGRILGVSGILSNAITFREGWKWRMIFLSGLGIGGKVMTILYPTILNLEDGVVAQSTLLKWAAAGALVGLGTKLGSGCTSGHMLCGCSRLSPRSLVASATFFTTGVLTTALLHRGRTVAVKWVFPTSIDEVSHLVLLVGAAITSFEILKMWGKKRLEDAKDHEENNLAFNLVAFTSGFWFSVGLALSGMTQPATVIGFLDFFRPKFFDPSLFMVVLGGLIPSAVTYFAHIRHKLKPSLAAQFSLPTKREIDWKLVTGAAFFGVGWGYMGICPGPGLVQLFANPSVKIATFIGGLIASSEMCGRLLSWSSQSSAKKTTVNGTS